MADEQDEDVEVVPEKKGGFLKHLLMGGGLLAVLTIGIFAGPVIQNLLGGSDDVVAESEEEPAEVEPNDDPELYQGLHPALVVNFRDALGEPHYMQMELEVMSRDQQVINAVRDHTPLIRNNLILLYGNVKYEDVVTREGKEDMLAEALAEIQGLMAERIGEPNVEAVYFTSLIIQ